MKIFAGSTSQTKWRTVTQLRGQPPSATLLLSSAWHSSRLLGDKYDNPGKWKKILAVLHRRREGRAQRPTGEFSKKAKKFFCHARKRTEEAADIRPLLFSRAERWRTRPLRWAEFRASRKLSTTVVSGLQAASRTTFYLKKTQIFRRGSGKLRSVYNVENKKKSQTFYVVDPPLRYFIYFAPLPPAHPSKCGRQTLYFLTVC